MAEAGASLDPNAHLFLRGSADLLKHHQSARLHLQEKLPDPGLGRILRIHHLGSPIAVDPVHAPDLVAVTAVVPDLVRIVTVVVPAPGVKGTEEPEGILAAVHAALTAVVAEEEAAPRRPCPVADVTRETGIILVPTGVWECLA